MTGGIILPEFNPFVIEFGGFGIRWYALAYIAGLVGGLFILRREARQPGAPLSLGQLDSLMNYVLIGIILGGRLGFVIFYDFGFYLSHPLEILKVWQGGMSFHGGLLGVTFGMLLFARRNAIPVLNISDRVAMVVPIGLFLGRLSNFINGELIGRATDVPWAMIFPNSDGFARHPSQLYEAGLEGLGLGLVMYVLARRGALRASGTLTAALLIGYGAVRFMVEYVREPDIQLGLLFNLITMGQLLCLPMIAGGVYLLMRKPNNHSRNGDTGTSGS
ncbi:prolipoprotein diacylglyceryl transferase [Alphaproteobacteria bacterium]|nr:prolipoprotein diacylglyceryl transferase [Alphaproteobacteria bacterium]